MARLDEPLIINGMRLRNRLALAPITTNYGTPDGEVTADLLGFYRQRACDVGLLVVEATGVRQDGRIHGRSLGLWNRAQQRGMGELARNIKGEGAAPVVQIVHAGARGRAAEIGIKGASPSGVTLRPDVEATVLDEGQIAEIAGSFADTAARAADAGFEGVEVHGAHLFLISQFMSPLTNMREDRYGGDAAGRATFALDVVRAIRERMGRGYPVLIRLNAVELMDGGQTVADTVLAARLLEAAGVDAIDASLISRGSWQEVEGRRYLNSASALAKGEPRGANSPHSAEIKRAVGIPVITVGKLGDADAAAKVVAEGAADVVALGRQMIVDPQTAGKMLSGRNEDIVPCQECMSCFASVSRNSHPLRCATNRNPAGAPVYATRDRSA